MAPKKPRNRTSATTSSTTSSTTVSLKRVKVTVEMKRKIVELKEQGMCVKDIARTFARPSSTICTILKNREKFMEVDASSGLTRISTKRLRILDDVEWLLLEWIRERHRLGESIDEQTICERARTIAADLVKALPVAAESPCTPPFEEEEFKASRGWFERFKQRTGMQDAPAAAAAAAPTGNGLLVAARQGATVNQGLPLLSAAVAATVNTSSSSSSSGSSGEIKENPDRRKTECEPPPAPVAPPPHPVTVDSADENSSSASSSSSAPEPVEGQQRTADDEVEQQLSSSVVSEMLRAWQSVAACIERYHPNRAVAAYVTAMFNEYGVAPVRLMWERMSQEQRH